MDEVGIVVPVYNVERFLRECVDSLLAQTYRNIRIILVDDGSTDHGPEICDEYAKQDSRIQVIHKKNGGLSDARNVGIEAFTGKYIMFVDSDDILFPDVVERLHELCVTEHADIACCGYMRCEETEHLKDLQRKPSDGILKRYSEDRMRCFFTENYINTVAWGKLYRSALFQEIRYPVGKYHEDVFTTHQLVHLAQRIVATDFVGYVYRKNAASITQKFSPKRLDSVEGALQQLHFMEKHYPELKTYAASKLIYACNQCVTQMGKAGYRDEKVEQNLQKLYRMYADDYCRNSRSFVNRTFVRLGKVNVRMAERISKII